MQGIMILLLCEKWLVLQPLAPSTAGYDDCRVQDYHDVVILTIISDFLADFGFARFLPGEMMAATLCGSPMYMVGSQSILWVWMRGRECSI